MAVGFLVYSATVFAIQPPPVEEFVPIGELPEEDRLPAAPFLVGAYSLVWVFAFGYFWMSVSYTHLTLPTNREV